MRHDLMIEPESTDSASPPTSTRRALAVLAAAVAGLLSAFLLGLFVLNGPEPLASIVRPISLLVPFGPAYAAYRRVLGPVSSAS